MLRLPLLVALAALALPASASAAPFGELPFTPVDGGVSCLRATGVPGELVRMATTGAQLMTASASGIADAGSVSAGAAPDTCPAVVEQPDGAGVAAFVAEPAKPLGPRALRVAVREPGGAWGAATPIPGANPTFGPFAAVNARGDAVVAWVQLLNASETPDAAVFASRRPAGGAFGAPQQLFKGPLLSYDVTLGVGVSDAGEALVSWTGAPTSGTALAFDLPVLVAAAAPGAAFGAAQQVLQSASGTTPALAVARDGRALLAAFADGGVQVAEREPGRPFSAATRIAAVSDPLGAQVAVALRAGGGGVVAWADLTDKRALAATRGGAGAFGAAVPIAPAEAAPRLDPILIALGRFFINAFGALTASLDDPRGGDMRAAVAPDGRALITWTGGIERGALHVSAERFAAVPLAGGHVDAGPLGSPLREPGAIVPLVLATGAPAVAWSDAAGGLLDPHARLRLALEGATTAADPPAPAVTVGKPLKTLLHSDASLVLPVRCSAACELLGVAGSVSGPEGAAALTGAGTVQLRIDPQLFGPPIAPLRRGPVRIRLYYGAPGARRPASKLVTVVLRRIAPPPRPRVLDLHAIRRGHEIIVTWRTDRPAAPADFIAAGTRTRSAAEEPIALGSGGSEKKRTSFKATVVPATGVRFVTLAIGNDTLQVVRLATVRVGR